MAEGESWRCGGDLQKASGDFLAVGRVAWDYITGRRDSTWSFPTLSAFKAGKQNIITEQKIDFVNPVLYNPEHTRHQAGNDQASVYMYSGRRENSSIGKRCSDFLETPRQGCSTALSCTRQELRVTGHVLA